MAFLMIRIIYKIKKNIIQMQLDDYIGKPKLIQYDMSNPRDYRRARVKFKKWLPVRSYKKREKNKKGLEKSRQTSLYEHSPAMIPPPVPGPHYLKRFRSLPVNSYECFAKDTILSNEWFLFQTLPNFTGYFNNIFEFNDFSFFDDVQEKLAREGTVFKDIFIHDVVAFELLRVQLGFKDYTGLEKIRQFVWGNPLEGILRNKSFYPTAKQVSRVMTSIPSNYFKKFHEILVLDAIDLGIIEPRILVWDTQFIRSNSNNNSNGETNVYSDPDAGYGRHNGKRLGVGYSDSNLAAYCGSWKRTFIMHYDLFPANDNDVPVFRKTLSNFLKRDIGDWVAVIGDTGAYSEGNMDFCTSHGIHPIIRAKKNLVNFPIKEGRKGYWFNSDYFPPGWSVDDVMSIYTRRPVIEAAQASNNTFYNSSRMNGRGIENAVRGRSLNYILDAAKDIAAFKLGRLDLFDTPTAFSVSRANMNRNSIPAHARDAGYETLDQFLPIKERIAFLDKLNRMK